MDGIGEGNINSYFRGGDIQEIMKSLHDLVVLLQFVPVLPRGLTKLIIGSPMLLLFKIMPIQVLLLLRGLNALFRAKDQPGRLYLKMLFLSLIKCRLTPSNSQLNAIKELAAHKPFKPLASATQFRQTIGGRSS